MGRASFRALRKACCGQRGASTNSRGRRSCLRVYCERLGSPGARCSDQRGTHRWLAADLHFVSVRQAVFARLRRPAQR